MSKQLKQSRRSGRRLFEKLTDVVVGLGDRSNELTLENLEDSGMFDKEQADALRAFLADAAEGARAYLLANPALLEDAVRSGKITESERLEALKDCLAVRNRKLLCGGRDE